jgi:hypothetical protein
VKKRFGCFKWLLPNKCVGSYGLSLPIEMKANAILKSICVVGVLEEPVALLHCGRDPSSFVSHEYRAS